MVEEPHGITINPMHVHPLVESLLSFSLFLLPADSVLHLTPLQYSPLLVYQQKDLLPPFDDSTLHVSSWDKC